MRAIDLAADEEIVWEARGVWSAGDSSMSFLANFRDVSGFSVLSWLGIGWNDPHVRVNFLSFFEQISRQWSLSKSLIVSLVIGIDKGSDDFFRSDSAENEAGVGIVQAGLIEVEGVKRSRVRLHRRFVSLVVDNVTDELHVFFACSAGAEHNRISCFLVDVISSDEENNTSSKRFADLWHADFKDRVPVLFIRIARSAALIFVSNVVWVAFRPIWVENPDWLEVLAAFYTLVLLRIVVSIFWAFFTDSFFINNTNALDAHELIGIPVVSIFTLANSVRAIFNFFRFQLGENREKRVVSFFKFDEHIIESAKLAVDPHLNIVELHLERQAVLESFFRHWSSKRR